MCINHTFCDLGTEFLPPCDKIGHIEINSMVWAHLPQLRGTINSGRLGILHDNGMIEMFWDGWTSCSGVAVPNGFTLSVPVINNALDGSIFSTLAIILPL